MIFSETSQRCLRFWYILAGNNVGTLKVFLSFEDNTKKLIWQTSTDKGIEWNEGTVSFNSEGMTYR
jgi:hypothetical protein